VEELGLEKIEMWRKEKGITQKDLSERSGVPLGTLTKITTGTTYDPKLETITAILNALGKNLNDLNDSTVPITRATTDTNREYNILNDFRALNRYGQEKAANYIKDLSDDYLSIAGIDEEGNFVDEFAKKESLEIICDMAKLPKEAIGDLKAVLEFLDSKYKNKG